MFMHYGLKVGDTGQYTGYNSYRRIDYGTDPMAYPTRGGRFYNEPALSVKYSDNDVNTELEYISHTISDIRPGVTQTSIIMQDPRQHIYHVGSGPDCSFTSIQNAIDATIQNAIDNDDYEIPDYIAYQQLLTQIIIEENELHAANDTESLAKIGKLKENLLNIMNEEGFVDLSNQPAQEEIATTEEGLGAGASEDITGAAAQAAAFAQPQVEDEFANPQEATNIGDNEIV